MLKLIPYSHVACFVPNPAGQSCATCLYFQPVCNLEYDRLPIQYPFIVSVSSADDIRYLEALECIDGACVFFREATLINLSSVWYCPKYAEIPKERQFKDTALTDINDDGSPYDGPTLLAGF